MKLLLISLLLIDFILGQELKYAHHAILDKNHKFHVFWTPREKDIVMELQVETKGYVAIGFSHNGGMKGADIFAAWVGDQGTVAKDYFSYDFKMPVEDTSQDYRLLSSFENETHTVVAFERDWDTCDKKQDMVLDANNIRLMWAYGENDEFEYHGTKARGSKSVYLTGVSAKPMPRGPDVKEWEIIAKSNMIPHDKNTMYGCHLVKLPPLKTKHQVIAYEPIIEKGNEDFVHHIVLYECIPKDTEMMDKSTITHMLEHYLQKDTTADCHTPNMPDAFGLCFERSTIGWAVGGGGYVLPDTAGLPLGEEHGGADYFLLEIHYDNPNGHKGVVDHSGLRVYYTDKLRPHDAALLSVAAPFDWKLHVPPGQESPYRVSALCIPNCTEKGLPMEGINVINGLLHSHLAGSAMRLRHIRDGKELTPILEDKHYDFNYQELREPTEKKVLLPGDQFIMECFYKTKDRVNMTFGGLSTKNEMCGAMLIVYPMPDLMYCGSFPTYENLFTAAKIKGEDDWKEDQWWAALTKFYDEKGSDVNYWLENNGARTKEYEMVMNSQFGSYCGYRKSMDFSPNVPYPKFAPYQKQEASCDG